MAYVSLYRKYRPQTFGDVVGQDHVTRTLRNALQEDRLSHAYLFTGPRGTGKTSTARILAKAINCEVGPTPTPCGVCGQCVAIADGTSVDVIELDMASHGGVDDARELRDRALFAPASARRKIYILDEVHMASTAAFNALLKLIEEPPSHVLFAMATTDPQKVLPTIMSRVQRLDLRRVAAPEVAALVRELCVEEGYAIEDGAVEAVVRAGDGSVRDTLSVLEQVLAFAGTEVTTAAVAQTLGQTPTERVIETVDLLGERDLAGLLGVVHGLLDEGHDLRRFTLDLVQHLRDLLVLAVAPDRPDLVDATDERRRRLQAQTTLLPRATLLRAVDLLAATIAEQRQGSPRLPLELALAKLAVPGADGDIADLVDRIARLEAGGGRTASARPAPATAPVHEDVSGTVDAEVARPVEPENETPAPAGASAPVRGPESHPTPAAGPIAPDADADAGPIAPDADADAGPIAPGIDADAVAADAAADPSAEVAEVAEGAGELEVLTAHWDGVLELLKQGSRRHHAMIEPAIPVAAGRGIVTLRYGQRHASFHAAQARTGELDKALREAILQACGMKVRIDISIEGDDDRRRPIPPSVTPDDARTPVLDDGPPRATPATATAASATPRPVVGERDGSTEDDEGAEVREAEHGGDTPVVDVDALLLDELDAQLVEEHGPPDDGR